ncbi:hypothetical protein ACM64Y_17990 [Novispirillum sp. DQ9]|uniref:hypothetical protein n=1 Tax=Novispirillum sp. DQ9 TaxID=3398612 RepID=UPI003C7D17D9
MTVSPIARASRLTLGLLTAALLGSTALAQDAGPLRLVPLESQRERPAEAWSPRDGAARPAPMPREITSGIVAVDDLGTISTDATGVLDPRAGGLPADLWAGSRRDVVARALEALPVAAPSPARHDLARRLLLLAAAPPTGDGPALIDLRAERLVALGATADALRLIAAVPANQMTETLAKARLDALLIEGGLDDACTLADQAVGRWDTPVWQKAQVFCALRGDRREQAGLALTMLREQGIDDPAFLWAAEQMSGVRGPAPGDIGTPTPLALAMLLHLGKPLPKGLVDKAEPWMLRAIALAPAGSKAAEPAVRVPAAERAALSGAVSPAELAAVYRAQTFPESAFAQPLAGIVGAPTPLSHALLFQLAEKQTLPAALAEVVARALELAERTGLGAPVAALHAPLIEKVAPAADLMWFAEPAARALYRAGRFDSAGEWFQAAANAAAADARARAVADSLWPLYRLSVEAVSDRWPEQRMAAWRSLMVQRAGETAGNEPTDTRVARLHARLLSLLHATGDRVEVTDWAPLWDALPVADGFVPRAPVWHAVAAAADELRVGETVLYGLMALGDAAPADVSDAALHRVVESLRVVGLEDAARRIAIEAAVAAGL